MAVVAEAETKKEKSALPPRGNGRSASTINLKDAFNLKSKENEDKDTVVVTDTSLDAPVLEEDLQRAWKEFAELRKNQIAEYNLLKKEYVLNGAVITVMLSNSIEEPLLQNIRVQLTAYLRNKLNNNSLTIATILTASEGKRIAYTPKEKFDLLIEKNPALKELKDRLGLDAEF